MAAVLTAVSGCGTLPSDEAIGRALKEQLLDERDVNLQRVEVYVEGRTVYLNGEVDNRIERTRAGELARRVPGVERVVNKLELVP